jgi:hypothetical protein
MHYEEAKTCLTSLFCFALLEQADSESGQDDNDLLFEIFALILLIRMLECWIMPTKMPSASAFDPMFGI